MVYYRNLDLATLVGVDRAVRASMDGGAKKSPRRQRGTASIAFVTMSE